METISGAPEHLSSSDADPNTSTYHTVLSYSMTSLQFPRPMATSQVATSAVFIALFISYTIITANKKNLRLDVLLESGVAEQDTVGLFSSAYESAQGFAKLASGVVLDFVSPSGALAAAMALTGIINVVFSRAPGLMPKVGLWGFNGAVQAFAWPALTSVFMGWFRDSPRRGTLYGVLSTSANVGALLCPSVIPAIVLWWGWEASFWVPGLVAIAVAVILASSVRDAALPSATGTVGSPSSIGIWGIVLAVVASRAVWLLSISYAFHSLARTAVADWTPVLLSSALPLPQRLANLCSTTYEVGGVIGSLLAGLVSDAVFSGRRGPVMVLSSVGFAALVAVLACALVAAQARGNADAELLVPGAEAFARAVGATILAQSTVTLPLLYGGIGALAFATHVLNGLAARELAPAGTGATAASVSKSIAQVGAACAGYPVSLAVRALGWPPVMFGLAVVALLSGAVLIPLWRVAPASALAEAPEAASPAAKSKVA